MARILRTERDRPRSTVVDESMTSTGKWDVRLTRRFSRHENRAGAAAENLPERVHETQNQLHSNGDHASK